MVAFLRQRLIRSVPVYGAVVGAVIVAGGVFLSPTTTLEGLVWTTGVASLIPAAAPPLGMTARLLLALGGGMLAAALLWSSLFLLVGPGGLLVRRPRRDDDLPVVRRADAHPDAPPRKPMSAADLGTPMMEVGVGKARDERGIPVDLDLPLAAFDPTAILPTPMAPARPVSSLIHISLNATESVALNRRAAAGSADPVVMLEPWDVPVAKGHADAELPTPEPTVVAPATAPAEPTTSPNEAAQPQTIEALLRRLEKGANRRRRLGAH